MPEPEAMTEPQAALADLRDLIRSHPAATVLVVLLLLLACATPILAVVELSNHLTTLNHNICTVVSQAGKGNAAQHQYWAEAAARATARAGQEHGTLHQLDLDTAANDLRIAAVYAPAHSFTFPGC